MSRLNPFHTPSKAFPAFEIEKDRSPGSLRNLLLRATSRVFSSPYQRRNLLPTTGYDDVSPRCAQAPAVKP
ncbi:hypothetical protein SAMN05216581_4608 [Pseudomonas asplenii]|uniref:Uncharacterized protein n=1 Tax=Pseudomonas asplenii TaxID=53407 RepID=A0A1H6NXR6_9PSED|nr:hypothetical protein SAMN05216581_4608 [Pseudomonas fuscovaginae]